jgi:hypothetical protein
MFGCLGRLGCLIFLAICAVILWFTHDSWYPKLRERFYQHPVVAAAKWEPLTPEGAARARVAIDKLSQKNGPVYVDVAAGDLAAFALDSALHGLSHTESDAAALARDDELSVRAMVDIADLGDTKALGPLGSVLNGKQEITVRGKLDVITPGHAEFRVDQVKIKDLPLPEPLIAKIVAKVHAQNHDTTTSATAIGVRVPRQLADVRIAKGHVVLYKAVP